MSTTSYTETQKILAPSSEHEHPGSVHEPVLFSKDKQWNDRPD